MQATDLFEISDNIIKSKFEFEPKHSSLVEAVLEKLNENGSRIAMVDCDSGKQWTASEMFDAILTLGVQFSELGISKGDVVAFFCPNSDFHVIAMFAVMSVGGVYTGLIHNNPLRELQNVINITKASYLVGCTENIEICNELLCTSTTVKQLFAIEHVSNANIVSIRSLLGNKLENNAKEELFKALSEMQQEQICKIGFSSGTTGIPKAVILTNNNCLANQTITSPGFEFVSPNDCTACVAHIVHNGQSSIFFMSLLRGAKCVISSDFESLNFIENVQKYCVTFAFLVPSNVNLMTREVLEPIDSFKLKKVLIAGEVLSKRISQEFIEKFKPDYFGQGFGSTEMNWATAKPTFDGVHNVTTCGLPLAGNQLKIVDLKTGEPLGPNQNGEILIKGPQVSPGYLNNDLATADAFDEYGFYKTGDMGYFDDNGYLFYVERIKEIIKYDGYQVSANELESLLLEYESVKEAAVVGIPDDVYGHLPKAFVVLEKKLSNNVTENELLQFVNERVAEYKKLRGGLVFMKSLPKTILGKIDIKKLQML